MYITKKLSKIVKPFIRQIIVLSVIMLLPAILNIALKEGLLYLLINHKNYVTAVSAIIIAWIVKRFLDYSFLKMKLKYSASFKEKYREKLFHKFFLLGPYYTDQKKSGEIVNTLWEKVEWINFYVINYIPTGIMIYLLSFICAACCIKKSVLLSLWILLCGMLVNLVPVVCRVFLHQTGEEEWNQNDDYYNVCLEGIKGIATLKAFNANKNYQKIVEEKSEENRKSIIRNLVKTTLNNKLLELVIFFAELSVFFIGIILNKNNQITLEELFALFVMMWGWAGETKNLCGAWFRGNKGIAAIESTFEILDEVLPGQMKVTSKIATEKKENLNNSTVEFNEVSFRYKKEDALALKNVSFIAKPGETTAFVGLSGSGKSTIVRLLYGFYAPASGTIRIGNHEMNGENAKWLQNNMTIIWQDTHIFNMSCLDNIRVARTDATIEEIQEAAKKAHIHELIMSLKDGYETIIGDGGRELSGGEKQRIALARAFLRNTPILVLDEATASLDRENEFLIQKCIKELSIGKTVIVIAHRLETIKNANMIYVMEKGKILEQGTHKILMDKKSRYYELSTISENAEDKAYAG